jgi:hypothetical protein
MNFYPIPTWFINKYNRSYKKSYNSIESYLENILKLEQYSDEIKKDIVDKTLLHKKLFIPFYIKKTSDAGINVNSLGEIKFNIPTDMTSFSSWDTYYYNGLERTDLFLNGVIIINDYQKLLNVVYSSLKKQYAILSDKYFLHISNVDAIFEKIEDEYHERVDNSWFEYNMSRIIKFNNKKIASK